MGQCIPICAKKQDKSQQRISRLPQESEQIIYFDRLSSSQIVLLRKKFEEHSKNGYIYRESFLLLFPSIKQFPEELEHFAFKAFDIKDSNKISYQELCYIISKYILGQNEDKLTFLFDLFDIERKKVLRPRQVTQLHNYILEKTQKEIFPERLSTSTSVSLEEFKQQYFSDIELIKLLEPFELVPTPMTEKLTLANLMNKCMRIGEKWNLISHNWMEAWKNYVGYEEEDFSLGVIIEKESRISSKPIEIDNSGLTGDLEIGLKLGIKEGSDYDVIPNEAWNALKNWYGGGPEYSREVVLQNERLVLDLYPTIFRVKVSGIKKHEEPEYLIVNEQKKIEEVISILSEKIGSDTESSLFEVRGDHYKLLEPSWYIKNFGFEGVVNCVLTANTTADEDTFPLEILENESFEEGENVEVLQNGHWLPFEIQKSTPIEYTLKGMWNQSDLVVMKHSEEIIRRPLRSPLKAEKVSNIKGIINIGNTCYTGTVLQSLFHTPMLKTYFTSESYIKDINKHNTESSNGKITTQIANLFQSIANPQHRFVTPEKLLKEFTKIHPQFEGNHQEDSHEFLRTLLDSLHEDLNRKTSEKSHEAKTITLEEPSAEAEKEASIKQWRDIQGKVGSVISDFCGGETRQKIECKECGNFKVIFETFMDISIPIPFKEEKSDLKVYFIPRYTLKFLRFSFELSSNFRPEDILEEICLETKAKLKNLVFAKVKKGAITKILSVKNELKNILPSSRERLYVYELTKEIEEAEKEGKNIPVKQGKSVENTKIKEKIDVKYLGHWVTGTIIDRKGDIIQVDLDVKDGKKLLFHKGDPFLARYRKHTQFEEPVVYTFPLVMTRKVNHKPELFGTPLMLSIGNWYNWSDLQEKTISLCKFFCIPTASSYESLANNLVILLLKTDTFKCAICSNPRCGGCKINPSREELASSRQILENSTICVYWKRDNYYLHKQATIVERLDVFNIQQCLEEFVSEETIEMRCESCENPEMITRTEIWRLPDILIIHLKRFYYKRLSMYKINNLVEFPLSKLYLKDFMLSTEIEEGITVFNSKYNFEYELYSVVNHIGSAQGGHYTCFSLNEGSTWLEYDDERVFQLNRTDEIITPKAYILFYRRKRFNSCNLINLSDMGVN